MTTSTIATDVVAAQIAGLDAEVVRIDEQIAVLKARREGIVMMKGALEPLLTNRPNAAQLALPVGDGQTTPLAMIASSADQASPTSGTGFRDAVRKILRDFPKGLRPAEVVAELGRRGELVRYTGKAKPSVRVHNELYVLRKSGAITRKGHKYAINTVQTGTIN
jgi:hypothetical protein